MKDLWRWSRDPLGLLEQGASTGGVFTLRLWRKMIIGYRPSWNRAILSDLDTFRSSGSLSGLTPYLNGGVVQLDAPDHDPRRRLLNPSFHDRSLDDVGRQMAVAVDEVLPRHDFDALEWSGVAVRAMLNAAFFGGTMPDRLLEAFLRPLERPLPHPLSRRPVLFGRIDRVIRTVLADAPEGTLAAAVADLPDAAEELRVALAAGYDTTAHTLAWAIWLLGEHSQWQDPAALPRVIDEVLRLYPAGWLGTRVVSRDVELDGVHLEKGTLAGYSPYLTHRDPTLWDGAAQFRPDRFDNRPEPWSYLPFGGGSRTCLGTHLARRMLMTALAPLCERGLTAMRGDPAVRTSITLRPAGPLWVIPGLRPYSLFGRSAFGLPALGRSAA